MDRSIKDCKKVYQPRTITAKDKKGNWVTDCHSLFTRYRNHFSRLLNVHRANDVQQTEINMAEPLLPEPSAFEVEMAIEKLKRHKLPGTNQIPADLIKAGGRTIHSEIYKLIDST